MQARLDSVQVSLGKGEGPSSIGFSGGGGNSGLIPYATLGKQGSLGGRTRPTALALCLTPVLWQVVTWVHSPVEE